MRCRSEGGCGVGCGVRRSEGGGGVRCRRVGVG